MKLFINVLLLFIFSIGYSQSYMGYTTHATELIDSNNTVMKKLPKGEGLFIISLENQHGHYNVIHIKTNKEGFVLRKHISIEKVVPQINENIFSSIRKSEFKEPLVKIYNNSKLDLTLKLGEKMYDLAPKEKKNIPLKRGKYYFRVSAPGFDPYYAVESLEEFKQYEWEFYVD